MNSGERLAARHYRLRGYRILAANARAGGHDLPHPPQGRRLVRYLVEGHVPVGAVDREKRRRVRRAAASWLQAHPETAELEIGFEVAAITDGRLERLDLASGE